MNDNGDDELCQLSHNDEDDGKEVALPAVQLLSIRHTPVLPIQSPPAVSDPKVLKYFVKRYSRFNRYILQFEFIGTALAVL